MKLVVAMTLSRPIALKGTEYPNRRETITLSSFGTVATHQLENGLKVLTKEVHATPIASLYIWYRVGARNERPGLTGISHWVVPPTGEQSEVIPRKRLAEPSSSPGLD